MTNAERERDARHRLAPGGAGTAGSMSAPVVDYYRSLFRGRDLVLDVGCGRGDFLWGRSVGVDLDADALPRDGRRTVVCDLTVGLPFADGKFEGILAKDIIEHVADPRALLAELRRITRPGGLLVVVTPRDVPRAVWADYTHVRGFSKAALRSVLADAGWTTGTMCRMGAVPLAGRLGVVRMIPGLLRIPGIGHYLGTNWQATAANGPGA
jgi:SAM-dependent methyltransferase